MAILNSDDTRLLVQGLGRDGAFQASLMRRFGTKMVAAVHPNRGGQKFEDEVPYFETARAAVEATDANTGAVFVPAPFVADALFEQIDAGLDVVVCVTEGAPILDMVKVRAYANQKGCRLIGPNCPGFIAPRPRAKVGIIPGEIVMPGGVGVVSRSGTLTYEAIAQLTNNGLGQSTCVGIGGDPVSGTTFVDVLEMFQNDAETELVVLIGEIGGVREQRAAEFIKSKMNKPVVAYIAGASAPTGKRMGHAGAVITGAGATAEAKKQALQNAGAKVVETPDQIAAAVRASL